MHLSKAANDILDSQYEGMAKIEEKLTNALQNIDHLTSAEIYNVSPEPIAKLVKQLLIQKGFQEHQFHHEIIRGNPNLSCIHPLI